jgi:ATP/maltotriose-dependent transcriptional regulator MalT/DNA-binding SARP family transcriptional activator
VLAGPAINASWQHSILRTKLLAPRPAPLLLQRPRLIERLTAGLAHSVTLVTANAGSGKTTLIADFVRAQPNPYVWYQLDQTDADPAVFLSYLAHGIRRVIPSFGATTLSYIEQSAAEIGRHPERASDVLLNEILDQVEQRLIIVLDDYHHLGSETTVHRIVERLLAYLPDLLHLIIISRDLPPFQLARLRSQGALMIIDRNDLLFTSEETSALFREVFGLELAPAQLAECRVRTQGWITALQLVWQVAQRSTGSLSDLSEVLRQSEFDIFEYFAEEVFADEPDEVQQYLLRISLFDRIEPDLCAQLYPEVDSTPLLASLLRRNVFLSVTSDSRGEEYRLHPLFRNFLRRRFRHLAGRAEVQAEEMRLAEHLLANNRWENAIAHLLAAEEFARAAETIVEHGRTWLNSGALISLAEAVDALPAEIFKIYPRALAYRAEVERLQGDYEAAGTRLRRAAALMRTLEDAEGEAEAFHSLATIARRRGDFAAAFESLDRAEALSDEHSPVRIMCGNTRGLCLVARGEWTEAERTFRAALQSAEERADEHHARLILHNLGLPAMIRGDFGEAIRWLRRLFGGDQTSAPRPQEAAGHLNLARCHLYRGELAESEYHLERALEQCQLFNLIGLRGEILETYGNLWRERGNAARAHSSYDQAARAYTEAGIEPTQRELIEERALLTFETGDINGARLMVEGLIAARLARRDEMELQTARLTWGRLRIAEGSTEEARTALAPALDYFRTHGLYYYEAQAQLALARCESAAGREREMLEHLRRTLELAARYDYEYWLQRELTAHPELFRATEARMLLPLDLRELMPATAPPRAPVSPPATTAPPSAVEAVPCPTVDLTINLLGPVDIYRDPLRPFAADAWTTRRAREIFCYIVAQRQRRASKDLIIDTFWGESEFDLIAKNFHPTISHIRKALNSNQPLKYNFLLYRDNHYLLNPEYSYAIDIEEFDRLIAAAVKARRAGDGEKAVTCYERAVELYRGQFLAGGDEPWIDEHRAYFQEQHLQALEALVVSAQKNEEWARSLKLAAQILREDPYREDIYCLLMRTHAIQGNRVAVREQYETLRRLLDDELGVEPGVETQNAYRQLLGENPPARRRPERAPFSRRSG